MSFLDIDEQLLALADKIELVYSPLVDRKDFPDEVDVTLIEGAISSEADLEKIKHIREHTHILISLGDCAVTGNVPALRNSIGAESVLRRAYLDPALLDPQLPTESLPRLLPIVTPVHAAVKVDIYVPGCPPSSKTILYVLSELLAGRTPDLTGKTRFGA
jgi:NAD-reducing hydrogenase small subunit